MAKKRKPINDKDTMRDHYDFSTMKTVRNPYYRHLTTPITIRIENDSLVYFKQLAEECKVPYQRLINIYLHDCVEKRKKPRTEWEP